MATSKTKAVEKDEILRSAGSLRVVLGKTYRDSISGLTGIAVSRTVFLYSCVRVAIQPPTLNKDDGGPTAAFYIDEQMLEEVPQKKEIPYLEEADEVTLGKTYKDSITGLEGVATSVTKFLSASQRVVLQPTKLHEGKPIDAQVFDASQLEEVKAKVTPKPKAADKTPGGPGDVARPHSVPRR